MGRRWIKHFQRSDNYSSSLVELERFETLCVPLMKPSICIILIYVFRSTKGSSFWSLCSLLFCAVTYYTASIKSRFNLSNIRRLFLALMALSSFIFFYLSDSSLSSCLDLCFLIFSSDDSKTCEVRVGSPWINRSILFFCSAFFTFLVSDEEFLLISLIVVVSWWLARPMKLLKLLLLDD